MGSGFDEAIYWIISPGGTTDYCNYKTQNKVFNVCLLERCLPVESMLVHFWLHCWTSNFFLWILCLTSRFWLLVSLCVSAQSQSHIATDGQSVCKSRCGAPSGAHDQIFITVWQLQSCFCGVPSLTRERVCLLYIYAVVPCQCSHSRVRVAWYSRPYFIITDLRLLFSSPPTTRMVTVEVIVCFSTESESYVTTNGQSATLSWNKAPIWGLRPDFYYCQTAGGLLMCAVLSDERTGLSFTIDAGHRHSSHSQVRVPWDSRPYFTVSNSRLPFSSPPTTRRATVEVFDPASIRDVRCYLRWSDGLEDTFSKGSVFHFRGNSLPMYGSSR
jgi:hypothetical protein